MRQEKLFAFNYNWANLIVANPTPLPLANKCRIGALFSCTLSYTPIHSPPALAKLVASVRSLFIHLQKHLLWHVVKNTCFRKKPVPYTRK